MAAQAEKADRAWYILDPTEMFGYVNDRPGGRRFHEELVRELARACASPGQRAVTRADQVMAWRTAVVIPTGEKTTHHNRCYDPAVELSKEQAEALDRFVKILQGLVDAVRVKARQAGRSLLLGLASGELSAAEFDDRATRHDDPHER